MQIRRIFLEEVKRSFLVIMVVGGIFVLSNCQRKGFYTLKDSKESITIFTKQYTIQIIKHGFKYQFSRPGGKIIAPHHSTSGLLIGENGQEPLKVSSTRLINKNEKGVEL